jgi:hypothetical protein
VIESIRAPYVSKKFIKLQVHKVHQVGTIPLLSTCAFINLKLSTKLFVGKWEQCQKSSSLDGGIELALVTSAIVIAAGWLDFAPAI